MLLHYLSFLVRYLSFVISVLHHGLLMSMPGLAEFVA